MGERRLAHCGRSLAAINSYLDFLETRSILVITHASKLTSENCNIIQCASDIADADLMARCHTLLTDIWVDQSNRETTVSASKLVMLARYALTNQSNLYLFHGTNKHGCVLPKALLKVDKFTTCLLYTSPSPRDGLLSRMPSSA